MQTEMKSLQEIADIMCLHLLKQKKKSEGSHIPMCTETQMEVNFCLYNDGHGNKCAVGCLLGGNYEPEMENEHYTKSSVSAALKANGVDVDGDDAVKNLLEGFQGVHDQLTVQSWPKSLRIQYDERGLKVPDALHIYANLPPEVDWTQVGVNATGG